MCGRLEKLKKKRFLDEMQSNKKGINKEFMKTGEIKPREPLDKEEVLEESDFPMKARRVQNFVNQGPQKSGGSLPQNKHYNREALVEIEETEEPSIHMPPKQRITDKPANMQNRDDEPFTGTSQN